MGRNKVEDGNKIFSYTICLRKNQIEWLTNHLEFKTNKFFRDQLEKMITFKKSMEQL